MSSLFNHIFIPVAILFLFSKKLKLNPTEVITLSFFAALPDADSLFFVLKFSPTPLHRVLFHNVFIVIIPLLLLIFVKKRRQVSGIICFYLTSHLILDLFTGGISLFYPIYHDIFFVHAELLFTDGSFIPALEYGISDRIMNMGIGEPAISSENIAASVLLIISAAMAAGGINRKTR
ncbi:hypothetical protein METP2_03095 [Methanosarcinales archaeon]|nr:metal-dependent hydrolase [Candidatus Methanoperedens sp.]CAG0998569.1 hypothetical protein METP2_03095 [Methanosarcinales archaeon]